jgi:hypothetical protein
VTIRLLLVLLPFTAAASSSDAVCAACHAAETTHHHATPMSQALETVADCAILKSHPELTFEEGDYRSTIVRRESQSILSVTHGSETLTVPLLWAFGRGQAGQTYVFEYHGALYESRASFYNALGKLDYTMGALGSRPQSIEQAAGRKMDALGSRDCFGCHSTGAVSGGKLHLETIVPGVGCESCHAQAEQHAEAAKAGNPAAAHMAHLASMSAEDMGELCGRCHRTWSQIALNGLRGVNNVRFQPYRLANSKCYDGADARIRCSACHDPHGTLETRLTAYDAKCGACHSATLHTKVCKVAKANCAGCHMPKVDLPGAHARFTDHQIRVVRAGDPYPN